MFVLTVVLLSFMFPPSSLSVMHGLILLGCESHLLLQTALCVLPLSLGALRQKLRESFFLGLLGYG